MKVRRVRSTPRLSSRPRAASCPWRCERFVKVAGSAGLFLIKAGL